MRYIDLDLLLRDPETLPLIDAAEKARSAILAAHDQVTRKKLIEDHRDIWVAFRPRFEAVFGAKCWYTESRNPGTDDDIDHFRPKGSVADCPAHGGYWWEALNWRNFRLCCHLANRPRRHPVTGKTHGKHNHFPILVNLDRWEGPASVCRECPTLLDPTVPEDPPLLAFDPDGHVALSPYYRTSSVAAERVEASRDYLNLDWPAFVQDRRDLYATILAKVGEGDDAEFRFSQGEAGAREALRSVARDLIRRAEDHAPYSRAARSYILRFRDRQWMKEFVLAHIPSFLDTTNA